MAFQSTEQPAINGRKRRDEYAHAQKVHRKWEAKQIKQSRLQKDRELALSLFNGAASKVSDILQKVMEKSKVAAEIAKASREKEHQELLEFLTRQKEERALLVKEQRVLELERKKVAAKAVLALKAREIVGKEAKPADNLRNGKEEKPAMHSSSCNFSLMISSAVSTLVYPSILEEVSENLKKDVSDLIGYHSPKFVNKKDLFSTAEEDCMNDSSYYKYI